MTGEELDELELRFASTLTGGGGLRAFARAVESAEREACAHEADHWQAIENRKGTRPHQAGAYIAAAIRGRSKTSL